MSTRESFVKHFGEAQARAIENAALMHQNGIHDRRGSDPFRWAICICIGFQCMEVDRYRESHGITALWDDIETWIKDHGDLAHHDGDIDFISLFAGVYDQYVLDAVPEHQEQTP